MGKPLPVCEVNTPQLLTHRPNLPVKGEGAIEITVEYIPYYGAPFLCMGRLTDTIILTECALAQTEE